MTAPETLLELAERCGAATGPDRELDRAIANGVIGWPMFAIPGNRSWQFTASLDAAMTLVPEGWERIETTSLNYTDGSVRHYAAVNFMQPSKAATPTLALCAAALKARAQAKDSK